MNNTSKEIAYDDGMSNLEDEDFRNKLRVDIDKLIKPISKKQLYDDEFGLYDWNELEKEVEVLKNQLMNRQEAITKVTQLMLEYEITINDVWEEIENE